jgi:hypothetical protein
MTKINKCLERTVYIVLFSKSECTVAHLKQFEVVYIVLFSKAECTVL